MFPFKIHPLGLAHGVRVGLCLLKNKHAGDLSSRLLQITLIIKDLDQKSKLQTPLHTPPSTGRT